MGHYDERPPRHGHRTPSELAEDEILAAVHGDYCGMPASFDDTGPTTDTGCTRSTEVALVPWADAHPDTMTGVTQPMRSSSNAGVSNGLHPPNAPLKGQE